jgi:hypothetical protein
MNVVANLNSVYVINKPCVCSSTMRLSTFCGLRRDTEQNRLYELYNLYMLYIAYPLDACMLLVLVT